jgi:hypothetical protein
MGRFWRENRLLVLAFAVLVAIALWFAMGAVRHALEFDVAKEQPLAPWMTPRYVAHSWDVPREAMMDILGLEPDNPRRRTLEEIAAEKGVPVADYIAGIEAGITAFRAERSR